MDPGLPSSPQAAAQWHATWVSAPPFSTGRSTVRQASATPARSASPEASTWQRTWKRQPEGTFEGSGLAGQDDRFALRLGRTDSSARVYGC
ncbi:hypothetical protein SMICM304S_01597 [Streptomyces microflavus]